MRLVTEELVPLHSLPMEMSVLGSMMLRPETAMDVNRILDVEDFYRPAHRDIYRTIKNLVQAGKLPNLEFVLQELRDRQILHEIGGEDYLVQIAEYVPSPESAQYYASEVIAKSTLRRLENAGRDIVAIVHDPDEPDIDAKIEKADRLVSDVRNRKVGIHGPGARVVSKLSPAANTPKKRGIKTYITPIDKSTSVYGLPAGQFALVAAYTKAGKTALMRQIAIEVARNGGRVLYGLFADLIKEEFEAMVMKYLTGYNHTPDQADGLDAIADWDKTREEIDLMWDFDVYDPQDMDIDQAGHIETFMAYALREHERYPYDLVCIDYAQELTTREVKGDSSGYATGDICSRKVRGLARKLKTAATIVASQVTEGGKDKRDTTKGGRHWEERAGYVLYLKRDEEDAISMEVKYQRFGKSGIKWSMDWDPTRLSYH